MIQFKTDIKKFGDQGEKTGWSYIEVPQKEADKLKPGYKKSYRVKGFLMIIKLKRQVFFPWEVEILLFQ